MRSHVVVVFLCNQQVKAVSAEVRALSAVKHRYIVEFYYSEEIRHTLLLFLEYMEGVRHHYMQTIRKVTL